MKNKLTLLAIAIGAAGFVSGCNQRRETAPPPTPQAQAVAVPYYYYPDVEVYYHPEAKVYWWHGGGGWVSGPRPPAPIVLRDDARVTVNLNGSEPWRQHEVVLKQHPHGGKK